MWKSTRMRHQNLEFSSEDHSDGSLSRSDLTEECYELWRHDRITESIRQSQLLLIEHLTKIFANIFPSGAWYQIGSTINGFGHNHSQLDLCLMLSHEILTDFEASFILQKLAHHFRQTEYFQQVRLMQQTFPTLSFTDLLTSIRCTIYINQAILIRSTLIMRFYSECDHRVALLVHAVKYWAEKNHLQSRMLNCLNGYCLCLMSIYYIQISSCSSLIVPRFSDFLTEKKWQNQSDVRQLDLIDAVDLAKIWVSTNVSLDVADLFVGFLKFYAMEFDFLNDVISIRTGRKMNKRAMSQIIDRNHRYITVEEPLTGVNLTSAINSEKLFQELLYIFRTSYHRLISNYQLVSLQATQ